MSRKNRAFTLVEIQVAILISVVILAVTISAYVFYSKSFSAGNAYLDVYANSRIAMGWMAKDVRWAAQILPISSLGSTVYTTSDNCIVLSVPSIRDSGGNIVIVPAQFDEMIYEVQNGGLHRIVNPFNTGPTPSVRQAEDRVIAARCDPLIFKSLNSTSGGVQSLSYFVGLGELPTLSTVYISLPLNQTVVFSQSAGNTPLIPTTAVKLRNKQ